jgi:hypothetical protein
MIAPPARADKGVNAVQSMLIDITA